MSLITIDQLQELMEDYPELAQCYCMPTEPAVGWDDFDLDWETHS